MDRIAMRTDFRTEVSDQAPVAKIGLLKKVELDIEPRVQPMERLERVVPEGFRDVRLDHRKIPDQEFEAEGFFGLEVVGEGPLRHARCANDVADRRAAISLFEHDAKALREYFFAKRWSRHRNSLSCWIRAKEFISVLREMLRAGLKIHRWKSFRGPREPAPVELMQSGQNSVQT